MSMTLHNLNSKAGSMINIRDAVVYDFDESITASKFPMLTDPSKATDAITNRQIKLAQCEGGTGHDNYLQGILVAFTMDITVKTSVDAERYNFLKIVSSTSTMHKIAEFDMDTCYCRYVDSRIKSIMNELVTEYNEMDDDDPRKPEKYLQILYSNPCGFIYTVRFTTNYRQLKTIYRQRKTHRLPEWRELCEWIETLPHAYLITGEEAHVL